MKQAVEPHGLHLFAETGRVGLLIGIVLQRNNQFLPTEMNTPHGQGSIPVFPRILFLIIGAVEQLESEVILGFGHLEQTAVGNGNAGVAPPVGMVVHLDVVHHAGLLVPAVNPQDISINTIVEGAGRDFDLRLGAADIVPHGINLVDGIGHKPVAHKEGGNTDEQAHHRHGH